MGEFRKYDAVHFSLDYAEGSGWVVEKNGTSYQVKVYAVVPEDEEREDIDDIEDRYGLYEGSCFDFPPESLRKISPDEMDGDFRLWLVRDILSDNEGKEEVGDDARECVRSNLEILCSLSVNSALVIKGYLCYGGSPYYECSWTDSRDCLETAFENTGDTDLANTLGYIYYYGRCSDGKADYDRAYRYFSTAALDGNHESLYKVGDMFLHGYGIQKNERLAEELYQRVYEETRKMILDGNRSNNFADAALRMAGCMERRTGLAKSYAYAKYLEADLGLKLRAYMNYYGDASVRKSVDAGLEKNRPERECTVAKSGYPEFADNFSFSRLNGNLMKVTVERSGNVVRAELEVVDRVSRRKSPDSYILLTLPCFSWCGFVRSYSFSCLLTEDEVCSFEDGKTTRIFCSEMEDIGSGLLLTDEKGSVHELYADSWKIRRPTKRDVFEPDWHYRF